MDQPDDTSPPGGTKMSRGFNQDVGAGLFLIVVAVIGVFASFGLRMTLPSGVGPGLMPRATSMILGGFGLLFVLQGLTTLGPRLEAWSLRGMFFLLGAVTIFAASVRPLAGATNFNHDIHVNGHTEHYRRGFVKSSSSEPGFGFDAARGRC